jgi:predicted outer membrane lipoprotein
MSIIGLWVVSIGVVFLSIMCGAHHLGFEITTWHVIFAGVLSPPLACVFLFCMAAMFTHMEDRARARRRAKAAASRFSGDQ